MIKKKIASSYWKLFFTAYWTAYNLGEKDSPEINASWLIILIFGINGFSILFLIMFINGGTLPTPKISVSLVLIISIIINLNVLFSKKNGYKKKIEEYKFLGKTENKKSGNRLLIVLSLGSILIMAISALLNNHTVQRFFSIE